MVAEKMASSSATWVLLADRGLIAVAGADARDFLQGIVTNDMETVSDSRAVYAALLTPQGKYLHDFFVFGIGGVLYLDCEAARCDDLRRRLAIYRLRADVAIEDASDAFSVYALFGAELWDAAGITPQEGATAPFGGGNSNSNPRREKSKTTANK